MARPFTFKINAAEFFAVVNSLHHKQRSTFLLQFSTDLVTLEPVTEYGKKVVSETIDFITKQSEYGKSGGKPKHRLPKGSLKAPPRLPLGSPYPKEEVKEEIIKEEYVTAKNRKLSGSKLVEFEEFMEAFQDRRGKAKAADSWLDIRPYTEDVFKQIIFSAKKYAAARSKILLENRTPKMAQGWLTDRRWEDDHAEAFVPTKTILNADGQYIQVPV